ncbi:nitroreductase [Pradoshia eiseniae]|uniref:Putative NAD(P)H nitroreductase n=1 Tax=Pradoshia eiseniae TaxID=2064768 RepID=A0A2S7N5E5_9BACI|nr:nitroreductase [Pradoshia eiseniae]PQD97170.1 nitroreductase [Pradoshia eiseniae]
MELFEAIKTRRSIGKVKDDPIPEELIRQIIEAATWAPCHHRTEPWRFTVLAGDGRDKLRDALVASLKTSMDDPETDENKQRLEKISKQPYRAPVIIVTAIEPAENDKVIREEEFAAGHAAVQNMLLAAHALGLGAVWRTGKPLYTRTMSEAFGLSEKGSVTGFIYIGYPDMTPPPAKRKPVDEITQWYS